MHYNYFSIASWILPLLVSLASVFSCRYFPSFAQIIELLDKHNEKRVIVDNLQILVT